MLDTRTGLSTGEAPAGTNAIRARMIGEEFVGATATIYLETAGGQEIRVQKGHEELAGLPLGIGQECTVFWTPGDGHLVPVA